MGDGKPRPPTPLSPPSVPPPPAEVRPQGSPATEVTDAEQLNGGVGLVTVDPLPVWGGKRGT